ncbi:hypothetical protein SH580_03960 [Coraliomargarita algicola]|uniref:Uncharacterized protein n=1 Tax=Coraliomargarita algicola TaxID=3092156 RepID=A0ABZ0RQ20_9BACT|nr:hypothetical protein [Coraliomargarita sp. J2-16]WPJ96860.1 hypothetical protein SH580_03960 [Coraliomargarita sp. J2-16]
MKEITKKDKLIAAEYEKAAPNQFGNLHERMKYLLSLIENIEEESPNADVKWAAYDLETEIKYHSPANPPFGTRVGYKSPDIR